MSMPPAAVAGSTLRARSSTELFDAAFALLRQNLRAVATLGAIAAAPFVALIGAAALATTRGSFAADSPDAGVVVAFMFAFLLVVLWTVACSGAFVVLFGAAYRGDHVAVADALRVARGRVGGLIGVSVLRYLALLVTALAVSIAAAVLGLVLPSWLGVLATFAGLVVVGAYVYARYLVAGPVLLLEGVGVGVAMDRAAKLSQGNIRNVLVPTLLLVVIFFVVNVCLSMGAGILASVSPVFAAAAVLLYFAVSLTYYPASGAIAALVYYDLRVRREGLDLALLADALGPADAA